MSTEEGFTPESYSRERLLLTSVAMRIMTMSDIETYDLSLSTNKNRIQSTRPFRFDNPGYECFSDGRDIYIPEPGSIPNSQKTIEFGQPENMANILKNRFGRYVTFEDGPFFQACSNVLRCLPENIVNRFDATGVHEDLMGLKVKIEKGKEVVLIAGRPFSYDSLRKGVLINNHVFKMVGYEKGDALKISLVEKDEDIFNEEEAKKNLLTPKARDEVDTWISSHHIKDSFKLDAFGFNGQQLFDIASLSFLAKGSALASRGFSWSKNVISRTRRDLKIIGTRFQSEAFALVFEEDENFREKSHIALLRLFQMFKEL